MPRDARESSGIAVNGQRPNSNTVNPTFRPVLPIRLKPHSTLLIFGLRAPHFGHVFADLETSVWQSRQAGIGSYRESDCTRVADCRRSACAKIARARSSADRGGRTSLLTDLRGRRLARLLGCRGFCVGGVIGAPL